MGRFTDAIKAEVSSYEESSWSGELGGVAVKLFAKPITPADMTKIARRHPDFQSRPDLAGMVDMIILKARDAEGEQAFDVSDRPFLNRLKGGQIGDIFGGLFGDAFEPETDEAFEERKKN